MASCVENVLEDKKTPSDQIVKFLSKCSLLKVYLQERIEVNSSAAKRQLKTRFSKKKWADQVLFSREVGRSLLKEESLT
jgi:hypothetical protein